MDTPEDYNRILSECKTNDGIASDLIVVVITMCGTLSSHIDLLTVSKQKVDGFEMSYEPNKKKKTIEEKGSKTKIKGGFYNSLKIIYNYTNSSGLTSKISSKVFPNGSIHLAGSRNIETAHNAPIKLYNLIKGIPESIKEPNNFKLDSLRINMIHSNLSFKSCILQERLKEKINEFKFDGTKNPEKVWRIATFQPEKYPGVNIRFWTESTCRYYSENNVKKSIKINGQVAILIFRSGKCTITGAKNMKDIKEAYDAITNLVRNNKNLLF